MSAIKAVLCKNCPWRKDAPKAGEAGGSVPAHGIGGMRAAAHRVTEGMQVMQCHKSSDAKPRPCAGFLSVVGYESIGVRFAALSGIIDPADVGAPIEGLYRSLPEMLKKADHIDLEAKPDVASTPR